MLYYHASAGFPPKETFLDAVHAGNYATWPGLTTQLINKQFPDSNETQKGHIKGQHHGIQSTGKKALDDIVAKEQHIQIKPDTENAPISQAKLYDDIFMRIVDLANTIYSDQTGAFLFILQCGNKYIMVAIHVNANNIFFKPKKKMEGEMIVA